jgi:hypothetical protein
MQLQQYGINPTSGLYASANRALNLQQAGMSAYAANAARSAADALGWNKKLQVAQLGQNYINATNSAGQVANSTVGTAGTLSSNFGTQANTYGQQGLSNIGTLFNTGLNSYNSLQNAWGNYGNLGVNIGNQNLKAQELANNQANADSAATGSAIGSIAAIGGTVAVAM